MIRNAFFISTWLILASMASHFAMAADSCQAIANAVGKLAATPTHIYSTTVNRGSDDKPTTSEMIYAKGAVYLKVGGNWMSTKLTTQEMATQERDKQRKGSCHYLKDESIGGEAAAVYSERSESGEAQAQMWISKSNGLLLREEMDIGSGGHGGTTHISMRYEYANVEAPKIR
ncbi:MAG: hypothetical protein ACYDA9_14365 [Terriglobia bacterium]